LWNAIRERASHLREPNEVRILRVVRDKGEISRIEIAKSTNLHKATVTDLVAKLIRGGFLEETGKVDAHRRVGRKRIFLRFRPLAGLVAGIDIRMTRVTVALTDLNAHILQQDSFPHAPTAAAHEVLSRAASTIENLLTTSKHPRSQLVGIGVGVQGVIDYRTNTLVLSHNKKSWEGESLSAELDSAFNVPVYVENDVKAMALGEYLLGKARGTKDFVHLWVGDGVGAGIMINGQLLHGITSSAGEIGYNGLEFSSSFRDRYPLTYRGQAMFGEILTDANFIESYRRHAARGGGAELTVADIAQKATAGDPVALHVIEEFASLLSTLCISVVNTLNPEMIIIGGKLAQGYPLVAEMLQDRIHRDLLAVPAEAVCVRAATHGEDGVILGAIGLVLYELFEPLHRRSVRSARRQSIPRAQRS
jgi:N-acetylglucosamine repressor